MSDPIAPDEQNDPLAKTKDDTEEQELRFRLFGQEYKLAQLDDLSYEEIEMIEDALGKSIADIDIRLAKFQRWLIYVSLRRAGRKDVAFEDLGRVKFSAAEIIDQEADGQGPTPSGVSAD